jgi:hypothetical protein
MHQGIGPAIGISEQDLKLLELLLQAGVRVFLLFQLVAQVVQLVVEGLQLFLELGPVPEQLQEPLLLGGIGAIDRRQLQTISLTWKSL